PVGVMQHVHHMGATDAWRVVQAGVIVAARLEVGDALLGMLLHRLLAAEDDGPGRAGLHAGRFHTHRHAIGTQAALVGLAVLLRDARDVERAAGDAVTATDALVLVEVDDAVGVLHDRPRARAGSKATGFGAVHAA